MDFDDKVPIFVGHILETNISQDTSVIEEYIYAPELLDCGFYHSFPMLNTVVIRDRFASCCSDLINNHIGGLAQYQSGPLYGQGFVVIPLKIVLLP
jgi:hypothetical protein